MSLAAVGGLASVLLYQADQAEKTRQIKLNLKMFDWAKELRLGLDAIQHPTPQVDRPRLFSHKVISPAIVEASTAVAETAGMDENKEDEIQIDHALDIAAAPIRVENPSELQTPASAAELELKSLRAVHKKIQLEKKKAVHEAQEMSIHAKEEMSSLPPDIIEIEVPNRAEPILDTQDLSLAALIIELPDPALDIILQEQLIEVAIEAPAPVHLATNQSKKIRVEAKKVKSIKHLAKKVEVEKVPEEPVLLAVNRAIPMLDSHIDAKPLAPEAAAILRLEKNPVHEDEEIGPTYQPLSESLHLEDDEQIEARPAAQFKGIPGEAPNRAAQEREVPDFLRQSLEVHPPVTTQTASKQVEYSASMQRVLTPETLNVIRERVSKAGAEKQRKEEQKDELKIQQASRSQGLVAQEDSIPAQKLSEPSAATEASEEFSSEEEEEGEEGKFFDQDEIQGPEGSLESSSPSSAGTKARLRFVDVQDVNQEVQMTSVQWLGGKRKNFEESPSHSKGWIKAEAEGLHPTLAFVSPSGSQEQNIPVLSSLSVLMMGQQENDLGLVYGRLSPHFEVSFSGRFEKVVYLDKDRQVLANSDSKQAREFIILNAEPGSHLVYVNGLASQAGKSGAVAVPVVGNRSTYLDLSVLSENSLKAYVLDASNAKSSPQGQIRTVVLGNNASGAFSKDNGFVSFNHVLSFGDHPIYLETEDRSGFKHRYQVQPQALASGSPVSLFRFSTEQIMEWIQQLSGGVSPQSGLIVGALPFLSAKHTGSDLFPGIYHLEMDSALKPETYTLSASGQLQVGEPLEEQSPRFLGVQIPSGLQTVEIENEKGEILWSEVVVSSPGVVNVLGP